MSKIPYPELPILIIDDDEHFLDSMTAILRLNGISNVECCQDSLEVMSILKNKKFSLILLDIRMLDIRDNELLPKIVEGYPEIPVIMISALNDVETASDCMKNGAFDYLVKPVETSQLIKTIQHALDFMHSKKEFVSLRESFFTEGPKHPHYFKDIITLNKKMLDIFKYIEVIAPSSISILITGETGTGKELIARAIHAVSQRKGDFIAGNIAGFDDQLFADILFGHVKGAFTGAVFARKGLIESAANGTLFLDEIGDLSLQSQIKLLRFIQEKEFYRLGSDKPTLINARLVVSTNRDLNTMTKEGKFRKDLFYRLETHHIHLPPLRERKEDIPLLVDYFTKETSKKLNIEMPHIPAELHKLLVSYYFPGNIRELQSMVYDAVSRYQSESLSLEVFLEKIKEQGGQNIITKAETGSEEGNVIFGSLLPTFGKMKKIYLEEVMKRANNNKTIAAKLAGLPRTTFNNYLKRAKEN